MKPILVIFLLAAVIDAQYYYSDYEPEPENFYHPYYGSLVQQPHYSSFFYPSYSRGALQQSYGRQFQQEPSYSYYNDYEPMYALYDPYEYNQQWVSPYVVRPSRPSYFWTTPGSYRRMARKGNKNKGNKKGNKKGGGHNEDEGGWWYIRDKKGCISGTWGKPPPHGLEREHYSQGACGYLGGHSQRGKGGPGWSLPIGGHKVGPASGNRIGGGGGYGGGGGGGYGGGRQGGRYASAYGR